MSSSEHSTSTPSHLWTMRFAVSLSAIIALFGTWGWLTHYGLLPRELAMVAGGVLMAGVCLVTQGVCNDMAVEARRARAAGLKWSFRAAALVALGFGAVSAVGLHHSWQIAVAVAPSAAAIPPPDWLMTSLFAFIAFGEPVSFWIVEAVKSGGDQVGRPAAPRAIGPGFATSWRQRRKELVAARGWRQHRALFVRPLRRTEHLDRLSLPLYRPDRAARGEPLPLQSARL